MLRRQSSKSRPDLVRHKSVQSVHSVRLEHHDPVLAQRDAQVAAHQAFTRARTRENASALTVFPPPLLDDAISLQEGLNNFQRRGDAEQNIPRRKSIRFISAGLTPGRPLSNANRARSHTVGSTLSRSQTPASICPKPNRQPPPLPQSCATTAEDQLRALAAGEEYYTAEDDIASGPSSYRRLRRSKSLFTSHGSTRSSKEKSSPVGPTLAPYQHMPAFVAHEELEICARPSPALRAPKSMSFLRSRRGRSSSLASEVNVVYDTQASHDSGVQLRKLRSRSSTLFGSKSRRLDFGMKRSLRNSTSQGDLPPEVHPPRTANSEPKNLTNRARKASRSLKSKLKNFLNMSKSDTFPSFPEQHIQSHKRHGLDLIKHRSSSSGIDSSLGHHKGASLSIVTSSKPSLHAVESSERLRSQKGSLESLNKNERRASDEKSRATSWTNSGPSTLNSEQLSAWGEWAKQRLSVIKENGSHAPSPSLRRPELEKQFLLSQDSLTGQPIPPGPTSDSQRIYSALMKKLEEDRQLAQSDQHSRSSKPYRHDNISPIGTHVSLSPSSSFRNLEQSTPVTIRYVKPEQCMDRHVASRGHRVDLDAQHLDQDAEAPTNKPNSASITDSLKDGACQLPVLKPGNGFSPAVYIAPRLKMPDEDRRSAFFGSPNCHLFRTASPYRRALQKSIVSADADLVAPAATASPAPSDNGTQIHRTVASDADDPEYSESIYSCATAEAETAMSQNATDLVGNFPEPPNISKHTVGHPSTYQATLYQPVSLDNPNHWNSWLSALNGGPRSETSFNPYDDKILHPSESTSCVHGHVRENAEIEDDIDHASVDLSNRALPIARPPATPLGSVQNNVMRFPLGQKGINMQTPPSARIVMAENEHPRLASEQLGTDTTNEVGPPPPPPAPPIPIKSSMRIPMSFRSPSQTPSKASLQVTESITPAGSRSRLQDVTKSPIAPASARLFQRSGVVYGGLTKSPSIFGSITSSPGLSAAVEKQFGVLANTDGLQAGGENRDIIACVTPETIAQEESSSYAAREAGLLGPCPADGQALGSKRMVDLFLSSRRRRLAASDESNAFL